MQGEISVLSGAPYGYRYERKSDEQAGGSAVIDAEAQMVRQKGRSTLGAVHGFGYPSQSCLSWYGLLWEDSAGCVRAYQQPDTTSAR